MPIVEALSCVHIVPGADALQDSTDDNTQGAFPPAPPTVVVEFIYNKVISKSPRIPKCEGAEWLLNKRRLRQIFELKGEII